MSPLIRLLADMNPSTARGSASALLEVSKHATCAAKLVGNGVAASLSEYICPPSIAEGTSLSRSDADCLPAVMALGFLATSDPALATKVVESGALFAVKRALLQETAQSHCKAACIWTVAQCGRHSAELAAAVAQLDLLRHVVHPLTLAAQTQRVREKSRSADRRNLKLEATCTSTSRSWERHAEQSSSLSSRPSPASAANAASLENDEADEAAYQDLLEKCAKCLAVVVPLVESLPAVQSALHADVEDGVTALLLGRVAALVAMPSANGDDADEPEEREQGAPTRPAAAVRALENRKLLLSSGGLKLVQTLRRVGNGQRGRGAMSAGTRNVGVSVNDAVEAINACFPPEVVAYSQQEQLQVLLGRL